MEAKLGHALQFTTWFNADKLGRTPGSFLHFYPSPESRERRQILSSGHWQYDRIRFMSLKATSSCRNSPGSLWQIESLHASLDEANILKNKSEEIEPYLEGRCIYLVGMMGSGKTTIGKILSKSLGYSFLDCDTSIEQSVGVHVKEIFKLHGESFFRDNEVRDNETEVLRKFSSMQQLVVSTGGGAVVRPINWKYMRKGVSVWLDVPLEALARRVAADGTQSRPLLCQESGDAYSVAFKRLTTLLEERGKSYANADARVRLEHIAAKLGYMDVFDLSPMVIAVEVLEQIERFMKR